MIRTCIIGVSGFGKVHYRDLLREVEAGRLQPVGATIINQDEEPEKVETLKALGARIFTDYRRMLAECDADLCMIPTGTPMHRVMTIDAVNADMHVYVEKPLAGSVQDARAIVEATAKSGKVVGVGYQDFYQAHTMQCKQAALAARIGKVLAVKGWATWPRGWKYYSRHGWAGQIRCGETWVLDSPYNNALSHELMFMLFFAGAAERQAGRPVEIEAELYHANPIPSADTCALRIMTDTGVPVLVWFTHACEKMAGSEIEIRGEHGRIVWTRNGSRLEDVDGNVVETWPVADDQRRVVMDVMLAAMRGDDVFYPNPAIASLQTLTANAVHEAAPVATVPDEYVDRPEIDGDRKAWIRGIEKSIAQAFREEKLFHELGLPWAVPAGRFVIPADYAYFPQAARLKSEK